MQESKRSDLNLTAFHVSGHAPGFSQHGWRVRPGELILAMDEGTRRLGRSQALGHTSMFRQIAGTSKVIDRRVGDRFPGKDPCY